MANRKFSDDLKSSTNSLLEQILDPYADTNAGKEKPEAGNSNHTELPKIPLRELTPFPDHRFAPLEGAAFEGMVESIKDIGVVQPIVVWKKEDTDGYIILSGHNRVRAARECGLYDIPAVILENLSDEDAVLIVTETNLRQRSFADLRHSERALCLSQHYEAIRKQGKRSDLVTEIESLINPSNQQGENASNNFVQNLHEVKKGSRSSQTIGDEYGLSPRNVANYIRIAQIENREILGLMDSGDIPFTAAVELSFIKGHPQLMAFIASLLLDPAYHCSIDIEKAKALRALYEAGKLTETSINDVFVNRKQPKKAPAYKIKNELIGQYLLPDWGTKKEIDLEIKNAFTFYKANKDGLLGNAVKFYEKHKNIISKLENLSDEELEALIGSVKPSR